MRTCVQTPRTCVMSQCALCNPSTGLGGGRDEQILGTHWLADDREWVICRSSEKAFLKNKVERSRGRHPTSISGLCLSSLPPPLHPTPVHILIVLPPPLHLIPVHILIALPPPLHPSPVHIQSGPPTSAPHSMHIPSVLPPHLCTPPKCINVIWFGGNFQTQISFP